MIHMTHKIKDTEFKLLTESNASVVNIRVITSLNNLVRAGLVIPFRTFNSNTGAGTPLTGSPVVSLKP